MNSSPEPKKVDTAVMDKSSIKNPFVIPGIKKLNIDSRLRADYTFGSFIEGDCNRLARSAGLAVAKRPGGTAFNPLVIFGDVGLGKTHLAHAVGNQVKDNFPDKNVLFVALRKRHFFRTVWIFFSSSPTCRHHHHHHHR